MPRSPCAPPCHTKPVCLKYGFCVFRHGLRIPRLASISTAIERDERVAPVEVHPSRGIAMTAPALRGLSPAPVTPFTRDGAVDHAAIQRLGSWLGSVPGVKS